MSRLSDDGATAVLQHIGLLRKLRSATAQAAMFACGGDAVKSRELRTDADAIQAELIADYGRLVRAAEEVR